MKKRLFCLLLCLIGVGGAGLSCSQAQTLAQVLCAVQNRNKLGYEAYNVYGQLYYNAQQADGNSPDAPFTITFQPIQWKGVSAFPTDQEVNAQPVEAQVVLLRQAWQQTASSAFGFYDLRSLSSGTGQLSHLQFEPLQTPITLENFHATLKILAARLGQMKAMDWYVETENYAISPDKDDIYQSYKRVHTLPTPPLSFSAGGRYQDKTTHDVPYDPQAGLSVNYGFVFDTWNRLAGGDDPAEDNWYFGSFINVAAPVASQAPVSFGGQVQLYSDLSYFVNATSGLTWPTSTGGKAQTLYTPGQQCWQNITLAKGATGTLSAPGVFGGDAAAFQLAGSWERAPGPTEEYYDYSAYYDTYFVPAYPGQSFAFWDGFYTPTSIYPDFDGPPWYYNSFSVPIRSRAVFVADFGQEFSAAAPLPEAAPRLIVTPDFLRNSLSVRLASEPRSDCELVWRFPAQDQESNYNSPICRTPAARNALFVRGSGNWDAVYSGRAFDREAEATWDGDADDPQGRWTSFSNYLSEWWQPVLTQLKAATYGLDITQVDAYSYKIAFYRADQMGQKDATTGRYKPSGDPVEMWTVANPTGDDAQTGTLIQAVRGDLTSTFTYNQGYFGRSVSTKDSTGATRSTTEQTSAFGSTQTLAIAGPEIINVTRTENASAVTTQTANTTTGQTRSESTDKATLATTVGGNATEPWKLTYTFPGGNSGWQRTTTHGNDAALTSTTTFDPLGRVTKEEAPSPTATGTATTTYAYTGGRLDTATDAKNVATQYTYQPDGSLKQVSRVGRSVTVSRTPIANAIAWVWKDATQATLWQRNYLPASGVTQDLPWGESAQMVTSTPALSGSTLSMATAGPNLSGAVSWQDGLPVSGSLTQGAAKTTWTAAGNAFQELTSQVVKPGDLAANAQTTAFSPLGLPSTDSGLVNAAYTNTFPNGVFTSQVSRNNHMLTNQRSPKGDDLGSSGYGVPDTTQNAPTYNGNTITRNLSSSLAGSTQFTSNLAGLLQGRQFPDGRAESFSYDASGALAGWTTPRASFDLAPNAFGQPTQIGAQTTIGYDLAGRVNAVSNASDATTQSYVEGQPDVETHTAGPLKGLSVDRDYDSLGRLKLVKLPGGKQVQYTYNGPGGALSAVTCAGGTTGTWSNFDPVTGQGGNLTLGALSTTSTWDGLGRNTSQTSTAGGGTWAYNSRQYDADGHCKSVNTPEGSWTYTFDNNTGWLHTAQGPQSLTYTFDEAGRTSGHAADWRPTARLNNAQVTIFGTVDKAARVNVQGATLPASGQNVPVNPTSGAFALSLTNVPGGWQTFLTRATLAGAGTGGTDAVADAVSQVFAPPKTEGLLYDESGNRKADARWTLTWNGLDQLSTVVEANPASPTTAMRLDLFYDLQGRRVQKQVSVGGTISKVTTTLWNGWQPVMEIDYTGAGVESARRYYSWGPDVSGSLTGAAGVGGLLETLEIKGSASTRSLPLYDGVGNVVGLMDAQSGARVASYQYGPFGEGLGVWGERAASCPLRFQTRLYDEETGLCYFGARYYDAQTQTWLSRDPLREAGGVNLYAYCHNDPVGRHDPLGLDDQLLRGLDRLDRNLDRLDRALGKAARASERLDRRKRRLEGDLARGFEAGLDARFEGGPGAALGQFGLGLTDPVVGLFSRPALDGRSPLVRFRAGEYSVAALDPLDNPRLLGSLASGEVLGGVMLRTFEVPMTSSLIRSPAALRLAHTKLNDWMTNEGFLQEMRSLRAQWDTKIRDLFDEGVPTNMAGRTRTGAIRKNPADWKATRDMWDRLGYADLLSDGNRMLIDQGLTPEVDAAWLLYFPEHAPYAGELIPMHHIGGTSLTIPAPQSLHLQSHMPGGFRYNPGGIPPAF